MLRRLEAIVDEDGVLRLLEPARLPAGCRAIVTILDPGTVQGVQSPLADLSEASLAQDWNRPEEDAAWSHLQPD